ncbi:hypothetical protein Ddye_022853 [Dipteronia dyeriana]|uniref:RNase H type-1 domain-containing protein n=1 Tax=Dipteronia dyeriana TaxID=168575 RepID=A0AAD9TRV2_9ROSI|nr:hypothetical protein Ddye_022853 [Dipteronia dyeriana]
MLTSFQKMVSRYVGCMGTGLDINLTSWKNVLNWSKEFLSEFYKADLGIRGNSEVKENKMIRKWVPPKEGMYKANYDTAVDSLRGKIGFGVVIRNCKEELIASSAQSVMANLSLKSAKLTTMCKSILFSCDCGLALCSFEMDEARIIKWIANADHRELKNGLILNDINSFVSNLGEMNFNPTDRHNNRVAQGLATFPIKSNKDTFWMEDFPICV